MMRSRDGNGNGNGMTRMSGAMMDRIARMVGGLMLVFELMGGVAGAQEPGLPVAPPRVRRARGRVPKQWSPPIPEGRAAVTLSIRSSPRVPAAKVTWGRRLLGETPLTLKWPRDSGPVDITVRAEGRLPVHTRLYTFADDKVAVKLPNDEEKKTLFGYRREVAPPETAPPVPGAPVSPVAVPGAPAAPSTVAVPGVPAVPGAVAVPGASPAVRAPEVPAAAGQSPPR